MFFCPSRFPAGFRQSHSQNIQDINNSGDGGIYAELIRNRAFQSGDESRYPVTLDGWSPVNGAKLSLKKLPKPLSSAIPYSMNVVAPSSSKKKVGFANDGYWGMDVKRQKYTGSFYVKGDYQGKSFTASLQSALNGEVFGTTEVPVKKDKKAGNEWVKYDFNLIPRKAASNSNNTFAITFDAAAVRGGSLDFNLISLFPPTYKNRPNGLRVDLMEALAAMKPVRCFPIPLQPRILSKICDRNSFASLAATCLRATPSQLGGSGTKRSEISRTAPATLVSGLILQLLASVWSNTCNGVKILT